MVIDSHVNLHSEKFADDLGAVIARARAAGVGGMLTICDKLASSRAIAEIVAAHDDIWRSVGVHPHYAKEEPTLAAARLVDMAREAKVVGIGECGLDFHYEYSPRDIQERVFRAHVAAARETGLPLIIHTRQADEPMRALLEEEYRKGAFTPLLHCYTGGPRLAEAVLAMGGYISFSGIITFKNAGDIRAIARAAPEDRIIIETDCPYLAPVPMRGKRNEPAFVVHVADKLAEIREVERTAIDETTSANFFTLFSRARAS
ncbi:MAG: TatD family hydrolase [Amphiplicatus sp.]